MIQSPPKKKKKQKQKTPFSLSPGNNKKQSKTKEDKNENQPLHNRNHSSSIKPIQLIIKIFSDKSNTYDGKASKYRNKIKQATNFNITIIQRRISFHPLHSTLGFKYNYSSLTHMIDILLLIKHAILNLEKKKISYNLLFLPEGEKKSDE